MIRVVTDSTCDLGQKAVDSLGVTVVPLHIQMGSQSYLDGVDISREEFYRRLPEFDPPPTQTPARCCRYTSRPA
jgi:fatty acid-binding protein DegV